jgi:uncharacterized protein (TIGR00299 family) protein
MTIAALLDLGVPRRHFEKELRKLGLADHYRLSMRQDRQEGITGLRFDVVVPGAKVTGRSHHGAHSHDQTFADIRRRIEKSRLPSTVRSRAVNVFRRIAVAEGRIHGMPVDKVHFHEVGAMDSIVDIVGVCILLQALAPQRILASVPSDGQGTLVCAHGRIPIPTPATLEILKSIPIRQIPVEGELITPTGAAILAEFIQGFGPMPVMTVRKIGYGVGSRRYPGHPNVLRAFWGETEAARSKAGDEVVDIIETNLDDVSPELLGAALEQLLLAGALDAFLAPILMKKGRPASLLTVLSRPEDTARLAQLLLAETGSFGLRVHRASRLCLEREIRRVRTPQGPVELKIGMLGGRILSAKPEFESCRKRAQKLKKPFRLVWTEAVAECARLLKNQPARRIS